MVAKNNPKKSDKKQNTGVQEATKKRTYSAQEVAEGWKNYNLKMPLSYTLAALKTVRER